MKRALLLTLVLLSTTSFAKSAPLPNWIDHSQESIDKGASRAQPTTPPPTGSFRIPAEYEKIKSVVLGWTAYPEILNGIVKNVLAETDAEIWAMQGPNTYENNSRYHKITCPINSVWVRDYGPFGLLERADANPAPAIVDTVYRHWQYRKNDDAAPRCLGSAENVPVYSMPLILDGGNFLIDSKGNFFTTKRTYMWNSDKSEEEVNRLLKAYYNVKTINVVEYAGFPGEPADGTGHIDMFVKLLSDDTVLISQANEEPFKSNAEKAVQYFSSIKAPNGQPYKIIRVKNWFDGKTWYTYTNSLIVNGMVMMPAYKGKDAENKAAAAAYEQGIPGVKVRMIYSDNSIVSGGSIHCVTQTIPE